MYKFVCVLTHVCILCVRVGSRDTREEYMCLEGKKEWTEMVMTPESVVSVCSLLLLPVQNKPVIEVIPLSAYFIGQTAEYNESYTTNMQKL